MMRSRAVVSVAVLGTALVTGAWLLHTGLADSPGAFGRARLFDDVLQHVARDFVDSIPVESLYVKATTGMVDGLHDPYTAYLGPKQLRSLTESTSGQYAGIGVQIDVRDGLITVIAALPGTPAAAAGIQPGDRIVSVDGKTAQSWTFEQASRALRGKPGSTVSLDVERPGVADQLPFTVERREIHVRSVRHPLMLTDRVGYIDLSMFSDSSVDELRDAIGELRRRGMQTLVFDLRSNPGGLLDQGVGIAGMFLGRGQRIVSIRGRTPSATHDFVNDASQLWPDLSLITLVDAHTASAAEIVAGALQDHDRSVIIGAPTYGKGVAQTILPLDDGAGALKLTTSRWFTPSGRSIQRPRPDSADDDNGAGDSAGADTSAFDSTYHTDAGRVVRGAGGITPDVIVPRDSATDPTVFWVALGADVQRFRDVLTDYALSVKAAHRVTAPAFVVTDEMREALWRRMQARGIHLDRARYDALRPQVDRIVGAEIARFVFGPEVAYERELRADRVVAAALGLAGGSTTEHQLLMKAAAEQTAARKSGVPPS